MGIDVWWVSPRMAQSVRMDQVRTCNGCYNCTSMHTGRLIYYIEHHNYLAWVVLCSAGVTWCRKSYNLLNNGAALNHG